MSNNKQSMKLYTEEQVKQIQQAILCNHKDAIMDENYCLNVTTPIELPSDKEIYAAAKIEALSHGTIAAYNLRWAFEAGAKMVINKTQGGNK